MAQAQGYPSKPVQLVVPFPPGGAVDIVGLPVGKLIANGLQPAWEPAAAVAARIEDELPRMRAIAQQANIRTE